MGGTDAALYVPSWAPIEAVVLSDEAWLNCAHFQGNLIMKVSIVIATYNCEKYISRALRSCIDQSMEKKDYEILVIDDGSTDNTKYILQSFGDWIRHVDLPENMGLPYACNVGIKNALSRFVIRVDADDYVHEDFLRVLYLHLALNEDFDAAACDYLLVDDREKTICRKSAAAEPIACGVLFRKDYLVDIGLYDENFRLAEDEDLRIRYQKKYNIHYVPLPLYRYRMHSNNSTKNGEMVDFYNNKLKEKHGDCEDLTASSNSK